MVIGRAGKPVARLEAVAPRRRDLSKPLLPELPPIDTDALFEPMDEQELAGWEGAHPGDPLLEGA